MTERKMDKSISYSHVTDIQGYASTFVMDSPCESLSHAIKVATLEWSAANLHPLTSIERKDLIGKILGAITQRQNVTVHADAFNGSARIGKTTEPRTYRTEDK